MTKRIPEMLESFSQLVASPSVSSTDPQWNQSNRGVVELLAGWLEGIGFNVEIIPVPVETNQGEGEEKFNLIACMGEGEGGLVLSAQNGRRLLGRGTAVRQAVERAVGHAQHLGRQGRVLLDHRADLAPLAATSASSATHVANPATNVKPIFHFMAILPNLVSGAKRAM